MNFGSNLKKIRIELNYSQQQLAERLNISRQGYSNYEKEGYSPTLETVERLANILDVPIQYLLFREDFIDIDDYKNKKLAMSQVLIVDAVKNEIKTEYELREFFIKRINEHINKLNYEGIARLASYFDELLQIKDYRGLTKKEKLKNQLEHSED